MLGGLGNLAGMMKQMKSLQSNVQQMQASLAEQRFDADAGGSFIE